MTQELTLKSIILTKVNTLLNPNYMNKVIMFTLVLGAALVGKNQLLNLLVSFEIITKDFSAKVNLYNGSDLVINIGGWLLIFIALYFFYMLHIKKIESTIKIYKNLKAASKDLKKLLEDNRRIFISCGPNSSGFNFDTLRQELSPWEDAKENIIVPNNDKIYEILLNIKKINKSEKKAVSAMKSHIEHFKVHVKKPNVDYSNHQFPKEFSDLIYSFTKITKKHDYFLNKVSEWLIKETSNQNISEIMLFGSCLYTEASNDIDVIFTTQDTTIDVIKNKSKYWKELSLKFREKFDIPLHSQVFSGIEKESFIEFKSKLKNIRKVL